MMGQCIIARRGGENLLVRDPIKFTNNKNGLYYGTISDEYTNNNVLLIVFREQYDTINRTYYYIVPSGSVVCVGGAGGNAKSPADFVSSKFYASSKTYTEFWNYLIMKPQ